MNILITGGLGFIGSHTSVELLREGYDVVIVDNLYNSKIEVVNKIKKIADKDFVHYIGDVSNKNLMQRVFQENKIDAVIHFAGYKAVGESVEKPIEYYTNNLTTTLVLCDVMRQYNCKNFVFSSSATVYGSPKSVPIKEDFDLGPTTNPYGTTKLMTEQILNDVYISDKTWNIALLRYFNPIGAHESGLIGESPNDIPNNLMPYIVKVAKKELPYLNVFGNDYDTSDGTGVRDYIHVVDLAKGHVKAIEKLAKDHIGIDSFNLGTGIGYSVLDVVQTFEQVNETKVPYKIVGRRAGDIAECYADTSKALANLNWKTEKTLDDMVKDSWHFINQSNS